MGGPWLKQAANPSSKEPGLPPDISFTAALPPVRRHIGADRPALGAYIFGPNDGTVGSATRFAALTARPRRSCPRDRGLAPDGVWGTVAPQD
jgi:hypothetical protein